MVRLEVDQCLDLNHGAFVTTNTLRHLKLLNKQWISISIETTLDVKHIGVVGKFEGSEEMRSWYPLQINLLKPQNTSLTPNDDVIYVNPADLFNIVKCSPALYKKYQNEAAQIRFKNLSLLSTSRADYAATKAVVSMITCPYGNVDDATVDEALQEFFRTAKFLREKELFPVLIHSHINNSSQSPFLLWFRVEKIVAKETSLVHENKGRFIDKYSELVLGANVQSHVPYCACMVKNRVRSLFELFASSKFVWQSFRQYFALLTDSLQIIQTGEVSTADATILIEAPVGYGKGLALQAFCFLYCLHFAEIDCLNVASESFSATEKRLKNIVEKAIGPCVLYFKNVHILCKDKEGEKEERRLVSFFSNLIKEIDCQQTILIVASTTNISQMSTRFFSLFMYHLSLDAPSQEERENILKSLINHQLPDLKEVAQKTSGFFLADFILLIRKVCQLKPMNNYFLEDTQNFGEGWKEVCLKAVDDIRASKSGTLSNVKVEKVSWNDVGGLENVKKDIFDTIELPMKFPHLFQKNMQRSGLLFYGPPGCGKTLLAKAVATEFNLNFYSVKGPELINMYVGQSEENVRETFKTARRMAPCVVFFDEIDSLAPSRGRTGDSGGVMDRIVSQLLSELDGMHDNTDVFIIAATNRPDLLDPALLRPGRFDKLIYVGVPEQQEERLKLLRAVTLKLQLAPDVCLETLVQQIPRNLTGADFKALATDASMCCVRRLIVAHENEKVTLNIDQAIITAADFKEAIRNCSSSVSLEELSRYNSIQNEMLHK